ncbi:hypothetical protein JW711_04525 [Candidatus Woesearchaeota archaeon]|nr:hypothetical protein [Candidatus Woesearchaeota archaeon]
MLRHNCGIVVGHTLHNTYAFLKSLQHRGREAAGIAAISKDRIDVVKWVGPVDAINIKTLHKIFKGGEYYAFFGHVRYATRGRKDQILNDAHPHTIGGNVIDYGSHVHIRDCDAAMIHNGQVDVDMLLRAGTDLSGLKTGCDTEALLHSLNQGVLDEESLLKTMPGAFMLAYARKHDDKVIVLRDRLGMKPGAIGWKDGSYVVASEDVAFLKNGAEFEKELRPGTAYYLFTDGSYRSKKVAESAALQHCFFEWNYLANKHTTMGDVLVKRLRENLGRELAKEFMPKDASLITFLPESPEDAAKAYAEEAGVQFRNTLYKMRAERSFQGSTANQRKESIARNLFIRPVIIPDLKGATLVVIDDSIVRGNNAKHAIRMLADAGVKKVYFLSYTPKIGIIGEDGEPRGCMWGVDMPPTDTFLARGRDNKEMTAELKPEKHPEFELEVRYLSREGMMRAYESLGIRREGLCTHCIGGKRPF